MYRIKDWSLTILTFCGLLVLFVLATIGSISFFLGFLVLLGVSFTLERKDGLRDIGESIDNFKENRI